MDEKTSQIHDWMRALDDHNKQRFAINWKIPHTLFNIACTLKPASDLQNVDWYAIYKTHDLGTFSNGNKVQVL